MESDERKKQGEKGPGRQPTAAQEQGEKEREESTEEAQEARERQVKFKRVRDACVEGSREQEKKGREEDDDEWVRVVPNMEAGSSYFQNTYPRAVVEKFVMDELEERKTGRGSDGLVQG